MVLGIKGEVMGLFGNKKSSIVYKPAPPVPKPEHRASSDEVMQHAGFERGWRAEPINAVHLRSGVVAQLFAEYEYAAMPAWCKDDGEAVVVIVHDQQVAQIPKGKAAAIRRLGNNVPAMAIFAGSATKPALQVFISTL